MKKQKTLLDLTHLMVRKIRINSLHSILISSFFALSTQTSHADDLMDLWKIAELNDAKYLSAEQKYLSDIEVMNLSRADLLPTLTFQYEHKSSDQTYNNSDNLIFDGKSDDFPTKTYGIILNQSVFDYARWQRYSQSEISSNRATVEYSLAKQDLLLRLAESYFLVLERSDQLETLTSEKAAMFKHLDSSEKKHASGLGRKVDIEDARARYLNAISKEVELQSRLTDSRYALREVLGESPGELSALRADIELELPVPANPDDWVEMSAERNLELQSLNLAVRIADKEMAALRAGHYPTLDLVYNYTNTNTEGSLFVGDSDIDNADLILQLNIPLYSGGKTSARFRQAVAKRNSAYQDRNDKQRNVERATYDAYNRISAAIVQIDALDQSVKAQKHLLKSKASGYRSGQNTLLEILDVEQDLSGAQQALTKARYDYVLNVLRLKFAAGDLQEEDLVLVNGWLTKG